MGKKFWEKKPVRRKINELGRKNGDQRRSGKVSRGEAGGGGGEEEGKEGGRMSVLENSE